MIIDIHSHILPGIDDGAKDWNVSLEMLAQSARANVCKVVATPHYYPWRENATAEEIRYLCQKVQDKLKKDYGLDVEVFPGQEIMYGIGVIEKLKAGKILTLADSRYVLLEFMPDESFSVMYRAVREMIDGGYIPILAHVERYGCLHQRESLKRLKEGGALFQMNINAPLGGVFSAQSRWARKLLKTEQIDYIASDMHDSRSRGPHTKGKIEAVSKIIGLEYLQKLLYENCEKIVGDV